MSRHGATLTRPSAPPVREAPASLPLSPWPVRSSRLLTLGVVVAGAVLVAAWYGCSGETSWGVQVRWFGLGVAACALNALGCLAWLSAGARALRRERVWTTAALRRRTPRPEPTAGEVPVPASTEVVTAARMRRYHRADCPSMRGKSPLPVTPDLAPCGLCGS